MQFARSIDLREAYSFYDSNSSISQLARMVENEMCKIERFPDEKLSQEFEDIRINFATMARNYTVTEDEFDDLMARLYNWGDQTVGEERICWVRII
jgi:hypothetical protein